ncbi:hypothetical protein T439DRAFT_329877 [Meredithblackwellia eburnea MCA 4105]
MDVDSPKAVEGGKGKKRARSEEQDTEEGGDDDDDPEDGPHLTSDVNLTNEPLLPLATVGQIFPSRAALQEHVCRSYFQRGYLVAVFQSPVLGTKRLLGLRCSRRGPPPHCPFKIYAGSLEKDDWNKGFKVVEITKKHNHLPVPQGDWEKRRMKRKKKEEGSADEDGSDDEDDVDTAPSGSGRKVVAPVPVLANGSAGGSGGNKKMFHITGAAFGARQDRGIVPRGPPASTSATTAPPLQQTPSGSGSDTYINQPLYFDPPARIPRPGVGAPTSVPAARPAPTVHIQPYLLTQTQWSTYLQHLDPNLAFLSEALAQPSLGCSPGTFFAEGADDEMRMRLLERVEGIPLWPRLVLMEKVAKSGKEVFERLKREGQLGLK